MSALKLSIKAGLDVTEVVQGTATMKAAIGSVGTEAASASRDYQSGAKAMVENSQAMASAAVAAGSANEAMAAAAVGAAVGVAGASQRMEDSLAGVTQAAKEAANAAGKVGATTTPPVNDNSGQVARLTAAVAALEAHLDPAAHSSQILAAQTDLLGQALEAGAIDGDKYAAVMERVREAHDRAGSEGVARMAAAVDHLEAELDPAARASQVLAARTAMLDKALTSGAISAERHTALMGRLKGSYDAVTGAGKLTQQQTVQLGYQLNDVFTSLASGASPFMVMAQQGGQVTQIFGGVRQTLARIPPVAWLAAAAVAVIAAPAILVGARLAEIGKETRGFNTAIAALNPQLGVSAARLREISFAVADAKGLGREAVSGGIRAVIANGRIQGEALVTGLVGVAGDIAAVKGGDLAAWADKLADGFGKGAAGVRELDDSLRFLTPAQARSIEAMERQGDRAGALAVAMSALEARFGGSAKAMQSEMEDAFSQMGRAWDRFVEGLAQSDLGQKGAELGTALLNGLRKAFAPTKDELLAGMNRNIAEMEAEGPNTLFGLIPQEKDRWQVRLDAMKAERDALDAEIKANKPPSTVPGTVPGTPEPPAPTGGMTDAEIKNIDRLKEALSLETKALAGNAAMRQVRLARLQAENAAYAAGRGKEAAEAEGLIAAQRAMLSINTAIRDQAAATTLATRGYSALAAARLDGTEAAMRAEAANAAAAEAATSPIDAQARARQLLAEAVAKQAADGAQAVASAEAEAAAQQRLAAAAGGAADAKAAVETANKVEIGTAPLRAAMAVAEGEAKDKLREIIERLTAAILEQDAAARQAANENTLATQRNELAGIVALTRVETEMRGASVREQRLALEHQRALNEAQKLGIDLSSDFGKEWLANADKIAKATLESQKFEASKRTADAFGSTLNALAGGDPVEIGKALADMTGGLEDLLATTNNAGEAFDLLADDIMNSTEAGQALGDLVGAMFGRTQEEQKNAKIGSTVGGTIGSFFGMKGLGSFIGNIAGGMIGGGRAERDAKAQKAAADLDALTGSINNFVAANSNVSQAGAALRSLDQDFANLSAEAKRLGTDTKTLDASYAAARKRLIANQNAGIYADLADLTGDVAGQFDALKRSQQEYIQAAIEGEADVGAARQVAYLQERAWLAERTSAELDALGDVVSLADRLKAKMRDLLASINDQMDKQLDKSRAALSLAQSSAAAYRSAQADFKSLRAELKQDSNLSTLTPQQQLAAALSQYASSRDAAAGGDIAAQREFATAARSYLEAARAYAGQDAYQKIFQAVDGDLAKAELSAAALAGGAEYQASLLEAQIRVLEAIRDNLGSASPDQALLKEQLAALGAINGLLSTSNELTIGQTKTLTAEQRAAASLTRDVSLALDSGLNIVDIKSIGGYLDILEGGLAGNNSEEAQKQRDAIAVLRKVTADGFIDATEAGPTREALVTLGGLAGDTTKAVNAQTGQVIHIGDLTDAQIDAIKDSTSLQGVGNNLIKTQTGEVISGNGGQDALAKLLLDGTAVSQQIVDAITGNNVLGAQTIDAVVKGSADVVTAINKWVGLAAEQAAADAAETARRAKEAAYQAQVDSASQATRTAANKAVSAAKALPTVEAAKNQHATGLTIDATSGRELGIIEDRGNDTSRARARGLADALAGVAKVIEGLTGGDIGTISVEAGDKYGIGYQVGDIRKINQFGINDFAGAVRAFVTDAVASVVGGDKDALAILGQQDFTDVASGLAAASAAIYKLRNPAPAFATGGRVIGPGTGTSDDVLSWLSNGEHVIRSATTSRFGHDVLDLVNRGDLRGAVDLAEAKGVLPRFAEGGPVGQVLSVPPVPRIGASQGVSASPASDDRLVRVIQQELRAVVEKLGDGQVLQTREARRFEAALKLILEVVTRTDARSARISGTGP